MSYNELSQKNGPSIMRVRMTAKQYLDLLEKAHAMPSDLIDFKLEIADAVLECLYGEYLAGQIKCIEEKHIKNPCLY